MKQFFDERQTQTAEHLGTISFYVIFLVSITAILIQLTFFSAPLQNVLGASADTAIGKYVCFFFIGITLISFIVTTLLGAGARKQERKQEEKYSD